MNKKRLEKFQKINHLFSEIDALYHLSSVRLGISDSESIVMYALYNANSECLLSDIYKTSGISKQTINSAIRSLERKEVLRLSNIDGRSKKAVFTEKGKCFAESTVGRLCKAETAAFEAWSDSEIEAVSALMQKYYDSFRIEIDRL